MDFVVFSLGCKVNAYEGRSMIKKLTDNGFTASEDLEKANNYIINTCSVTSEADKKSRQMVARVLNLNKDANVFVCGCSSQNSFEPFLGKPNVKLVGGTSGKMDFLDKILDYISDKDFDTLQSTNIVEPPKQYEDDLLPQVTKTRGYIKIQDGCNNFCSYCIIPHLRGRSRSRDLNSIVKEIKDISNSTKEVVITGINISDYHTEDKKDIIDLINAISKINVRKRLGSLECRIITEDFLKSIKDSDVCQHFHLSLQSGSDSVLKRMNRHYTTKEFLEKIDLIRKYFEYAGITTDIITGFSQETEEEHQETLEFLNKAKFSDMHIFPYSIRKGTKASTLIQVEKHIKLVRAKDIAIVKDKYKHEFLTKNLNQTLDVYFEDNDSEYSFGFTDNYIKVYTKDSDKNLVHTIEKQPLKEIFKDGIMS